jgi:Alpha/beta hydrolase domain
MELEILAQAGALLQRDPQDGPLHGVEVKHVLLAGFSGSAAVVRDFITDEHADARIDGGPVYEGYFPGQAAVGTVPGPIPDRDVPVIEVQGEREVIVTLEQNQGRLAYRRPDGRNYRLYEVAALPHLTTENGPSPLFPDPRCAWPQGASRSPFPLTHIWNMALDNLVTWVGEGVPAPHASRIELAGDGRTVVRDAHGNAVGGVPTAYVNVPVATLGSTSTTTPDSPPGTRCDMLGYQVAFGDEKLAELYGSHGGYVKRFSRQLDDLVHQRWYLPSDAKTARIKAAQSDVLR